MGSENPICNLSLTHYLTCDLPSTPYHSQCHILKSAVGSPRPISSVGVYRSKSGELLPPHGFRVRYPKRTSRGALAPHVRFGDRQVDVKDLGDQESKSPGPEF